jgi:hypothetical protein
LREAGLTVLDISPAGDLQANRWWTPTEIACTWPHLFDATSGHLPVDLMAAIGARFRAYLGDLPQDTTVPSGSGETVVCLALAYPNVRFTAIYGGSAATRYDQRAPLNPLVRRLARVQFQPMP